jgi:hypothetical protein
MKPKLFETNLDITHVRQTSVIDNNDKEKYFKEELVTMSE